MLERKDTDFRTNTRVQFLFKFRKKLYDCNNYSYTIHTHFQTKPVWDPNISSFNVFLAKPDQNV